LPQNENGRNDSCIIMNIFIIQHGNLHFFCYAINRNFGNKIFLSESIQIQILY
jgi:hypothetical protein